MEAVLANFTMARQRKEQLQKRIFQDMECPDFGRRVDHVSREDGCKVYFQDGSWVICRFSGTEPLLRMAAEGGSMEEAENDIQAWKAFLGL